MQTAHAFAAVAPRGRGEHARFTPQGRNVDAIGKSGLDQRALRRCSLDDIAAVGGLECGIAAKRRDFQKKSQDGLHAIRNRSSTARKQPCVQGEGRAADMDCGGGHAVLGERTSLVETENLDRAKGLDRIDLAHEDVALAHILDAERKRGGGNRRQSFRDGRHGK
jgi:hypothetical protein